MSDQVLKPEESPVPLMSHAEALTLGINVAKVRTCAVPKDGEVAGCPKADLCSARMFGQRENGAFGPKHNRPGTPGVGPENVPYYRLESSTSTEKEDYIPCYGFMIALFDMYRQQDQTGDIIEVVGRQGDQITQKETLPADPGKCNLNGNRAMAIVNKLVTVPLFPKYVAKSSSMSYALELRANRRAMAVARRRDRIASFGVQEGAPEVGEIVNADDAENLTGDDAVSAVAEPVAAKDGRGVGPRRGTARKG